MLAEDWLANTADPTPVFSLLVAGTARYLHPWVFHVYHALLLGAYAAGLLGVFSAVVGPQLARERWPVFLVLLVAIHSALARWLSYRLVNADYPWFFQAGVAGQYVLGAMFQPSVFGVLLVVALSLFVHDRPYLAGAVTALAADIHSTYLLPGAMLTLGFMVALALQRQVQTAWRVGVLTLVLVLPVMAHVVICFGPTSPQTFAEAHDILVNLRIPHHTRPDLWFDWVAALQILWVVGALGLVWGTRLFPVLLVSFLLGGVLTLVQIATGSQTLALLFPWRISAVLVPVATTVVLARLVGWERLPLTGRGVWFTSAVGLAGLVAAGVTIRLQHLAFRTGNEDRPLLEYVRAHRAPGDVYLVPVRIPDLVKSTHGSLSSDFKPLAEKRQDARVIPIDLQRFRLEAGTPIFVDFKSIPYKDTEVIEWRDRLYWVRELQEDLARGKVAEVVVEMRRQRITHLVTRAGTELAHPELHRIHQDPSYEVYRLREPAAGN